MLVLLYGFFRGFQRFEVFFEQIVHFDCIRQKRECRHNADEVRFFGRTKTNYIILNFVYTRRFVRDRSFLEVLILDRTRPVWSSPVLDPLSCHATPGREGPGSFVCACSSVSQFSS